LGKAQRVNDTKLGREYPNVVTFRRFLTCGKKMFVTCDIDYTQIWVDGRIPSPRRDE